MLNLGELLRGKGFKSSEEDAESSRTEGLTLTHSATNAIVTTVVRGPQAKVDAYVAWWRGQWGWAYNPHVSYKLDKQAGHVRARCTRYTSCD